LDLLLRRWGIDAGLLPDKQLHVGVDRLQHEVRWGCAKSAQQRDIDGELHPRHHRDGQRQSVAAVGPHHCQGWSDWCHDAAVRVRDAIPQPKLLSAGNVGGWYAVRERHRLHVPGH